MATAVNDFLLSLAVAIADLAELSMSTAPRRVFATTADEGGAAEEYSVLRIYGGDEPPALAGMRVANVRIQIDTRGQDATAVLAQAWTLHEALLDDQGRWRMHWTVAGKTLVENAIAEDPDGDWEVRTVRITSAPGIVRQDSDNRSFATSNFEVDFQRA